MQTKLTLRIDDRLIKKAKSWARTRGVSLSGAVAGFFSQLPETGEELDLSLWTKRLAGAAAGEDSDLSDDEIRKDYTDYIEEKHR